MSNWPAWSWMDEIDVTDARQRRVFSAGGHSFTWIDVIEAARARSDWAALQRDVIVLLARERELAAADALPPSGQVQAAAQAFRYQRNLLSADELEDWLSSRDISLAEWTAEMRRSLLEPADHEVSVASAEPAGHASWVHAVCSGKLATYARILAEEVAVHLGEQPLKLTPDELAALAQERERFCAAQVKEAALAEVIQNNTVGWTRLDLQYVVHADEMVVREAALCVRLDGRELADVAADAGLELYETSVVLDDTEPMLRTRLLSAGQGDLVGPCAAKSGHQLILVLGRIPPRLDDPAVRQRAADTIIRRALAAEVNRHVNWHEHI
jgi:hypothetical protein